MSCIKFALVLSVVVMTFGTLLPAVTYVAGTCKTPYKSFAHIQDALNATPSPTTVLVCPSSTPYPEQITISRPVNLQGMANSGIERAVIGVPQGGLTETATASDGSTVYFQIWVNNVSGGSVNISNLTVDGTGNGVLAGSIAAGVFFQNSPGSVSRVTTRNQAGNRLGIGVMLEGGSANPAVNVSNNSLRAFDDLGIYSETFSSITSELTATINANAIDASTAGSIGIHIENGATSTVSVNSILVGTGGGIVSDPSAGGSISGNNIQGNGNGFGIGANADAVPITGNKIFNTSTGILLPGETSVATVQNNNITDAASVGIDYGCEGDVNVIHNTINDAPIGINNVPSSLVVSNTYFNVDAIRSQGTCM